ncbi:MAG TPA: UDP-N-acetylmuramoyl-tripeptide--D-alanyl-D-alanine ligase, partial [Candidatus Paceibacterota bacterium]|nr:UDP-N-acetylmuramoyl-tripeptide--D-alanyl-D-alanine ligase [Candidatus Paceibacterota bacterium]
MRALLQSILTALARVYLARYRPMIIAVTGNVGKTSTKEIIAAIVSKQKHTRMSGGNLNSEIGVPMTIIGDWSERYYNEGSNWGFWLEVIFGGIVFLIIPQKYPEVLVLEYGADRPGDIDRLARQFKPHIGIVTAVGELPVHVEYFASANQLAGEKSKLVQALGSDDFAVLNYDDQTVLDMKEKTKGKVVTFGMADGADVKASNVDILIDQDHKSEGISFKIQSNGNTMPFKIYGSLGDGLAKATAAGVAVGNILSINLVDMSEALSDYIAPPGRLHILKGIKDTIILDDTYNAAPAAMHLALETLRDVPALRRVAILGDMLELGVHSIPAHQGIGNLAANIVDLLVCVGEKAKFIADSAGNQLNSNQILTFNTSQDVKYTIQKIIQEGDVILVKGSQ